MTKISQNRYHVFYDSKKIAPEEICPPNPKTNPKPNLYPNWGASLSLIYLHVFLLQKYSMNGKYHSCCCCFFISLLLFFRKNFFLKN